MRLDYKRVRYKNNYYAVIPIPYKKDKLPMVIDWKDLKVIEGLGKIWRCNKQGFVSCYHMHNDITKEIPIHELVMAMKQKSKGLKRQNIPVLHVNRIGLDNRRKNLLYDTVDKVTNKNIKKKQRTVKLPPESGIKPDEIPTFVWYMKPNGSHGDRFMVDVKGVTWKTTSSKKVSLRYKLEEAKKFLRDLKDGRPELFDSYSMNGDFTRDGQLFMDEFYTIVHRAGYNNIQRFIPNQNTDKFLKPKGGRRERSLLAKQDFGFGDPTRRRRLINNLPEDFGITSQELPRYCYFRPACKNRGSYFVYETKDEIWQTTSSKYVSLQDKYDELLEFLAD